MSSPLKSIWPTSVSQNRREVSCSLRFLAFTEENHLRFSNSKHFCFYWTKKHFISEWYFTKNHEIGSLVVRKVNGRIASLDQLRLGVEEQLLIFSSCLSPGRVKKLQKFIKLCVKVGHSANLKHSKSTWRQSSCDSSKCTKSAHRDRGTGTIYDSCRFDIGRFRVEPTDLRKVSTSQWQICISQCPTCS